MIYFDIDDTLLDYTTSQDVAARAFASTYASYIDDAEGFPRVWEEITERHMARYLSGELSFREQRRCRIRDCLGLNRRRHPEPCENQCTDLNEFVLKVTKA